MDAETTVWLPPILTGIFTVAVAVYASIGSSRRDQKRSLDQKFLKFEQVIEEGIEAQRREFGEALHAFREKTHQIEAKHQDLELYIRDNYVSKEDFKDTLSRIELSMRRIEGMIDDLRKPPPAQQ